MCATSVEKLACLGRWGDRSALLPLLLLLFLLAVVLAPVPRSGDACMTSNERAVSSSTAFIVGEPGGLGGGMDVSGCFGTDVFLVLVLLARSRDGVGGITRGSAMEMEEEEDGADGAMVCSVVASMWVVLPLPRLFFLGDGRSSALAACASISPVFARVLLELTRGGVEGNVCTLLVDDWAPLVEARRRVVILEEGVNFIYYDGDRNLLNMIFFCVIKYYVSEIERDRSEMGVVDERE